MRYMDPRTFLLICPPSEVICSQTYVDLTPLCDLAERLSGLFIMARRVNSPGRVLHDVTMPRSWFINLILPSTDLGKDTSSFFTFAQAMIDLMKQIYAQIQKPPTSTFGTEEKFTADGSRLTNLTGPLYIARM